MENPPLPKIEIHEDLQLYDLNLNSRFAKELCYIPKADGLEPADISSYYNDTDDPIIHFIKDEDGLPVAVYAFIEYKHLKTGEATRDNRMLAETIRDQGYKVGGRNVDLCGHIIPPCLGGKMKSENLYPVSNSKNLRNLKDAFTRIRNYIMKNQAKNGRVYFRALLSYKSRIYPSRPTDFEYSFRRICDEDDKQKEIVPNEMFFEVITGRGIVSIKEVNIIDAKSSAYDDKEIAAMRELFRESGKLSNYEEWAEFVLDISNKGCGYVTIFAGNYSAAKFVSGPPTIPGPEPTWFFQKLFYLKKLLP